MGSTVLAVSQTVLAVSQTVLAVSPLNSKFSVSHELSCYNLNTTNYRVKVILFFKTSLSKRSHERETIH